MAEREIAYLPECLNEEPVVVLGLTDAELRYAAAAGFGVLVPACALGGAAFGQAVVGAGAGAVLAIGAVYVVGNVLRRMKRGKPAGYHADRVRAWLEDRGLGGDSMLRASAVWEPVRIRTARPAARRDDADG
ncbi:MAG: TIGR03750 family conjugal transfer protein [Acidobacteria bacterium]|nr:TIGR03750 family conjugal transfer protein [Acidobacteriota bacterium]